MVWANRIELEISGERALFSEPLLSAGGERVTLPVPTYGALRGILRSVYYKPTIEWYPEELRVMNRISTDLAGMRRLRWSGGACVQTTLFLKNVRYRLRAHFAWNEQRPDLAPDRNEHRHFQGALRMAKRGGARPVFLGTSACPAEVRLRRFDEGRGFYDGSERIELGLVYCGRELCAAYPQALVMSGGVVRYGAPVLPQESL